MRLESPITWNFILNFAPLPPPSFGWLVHKQFGRGSIPPLGYRRHVATGNKFSSIRIRLASLCFHAKLPAKLAFVPYPWASSWIMNNWPERYILLGETAFLLGCLLLRTFIQSCSRSDGCAVACVFVFFSEGVKDKAQFHCCWRKKFDKSRFVQVKLVLCFLEAMVLR